MAATIHGLEKQNRSLADKENKSDSVLIGLEQEHKLQLAENKKSEQQILQLSNLVSKLELDIASKRRLLAPSEAADKQAHAAVVP